LGKLEYFKSYTCPRGNQYSVDKILQTFKYQIVSGEVACQSILNWLSIQTEIETDIWTSTKLFSYHYNFSVKCANKESFYIGFGFNNAKPDGQRYAKIEYNPNKVGNTEEFRKIYHSMHGAAYRSEIKRFDLAIDIPVERSRCELIKDNRTYEMIMNSKTDRTQYLGHRGEGNRVKLYNKQLEAKLDYPMTRLELTIDYNKASYQDVLTVMPKILIIADSQIDFDFSALSGTDRLILDAISDKPERIMMLDYRKREKIESIMARYNQPFAFSEKTYNSILSLLKELFNPVYY
jgi:hypothetical protein